jgi:hypothetical protein
MLFCSIPISPKVVSSRKPISAESWASYSAWSGVAVLPVGVAAEPTATDGRENRREERRLLP